MVENNPIPTETKTRDALLISLSGGIIGIIGVIAENHLLTSNSVDLNSIIFMGGTSLTGFGMALKGSEKYLNLRKASKNSK
jgi:hypothetical protein